MRRPTTKDFRAAGIAGSEVMRFEREGKRPDGAPVKLGFSLAFAEDRLAPQIHFATCQQHYPENFWNPAFQKHANGASASPASSRSPSGRSSIAPSCSTLPARRRPSQDGGFAIATPRGTIEMMTPAAFVGRFGVAAPDVSRGARLAALRFAVADRSLLQGLPERAGIAGLEAGNRAVVGRDDAMGAVLVFEVGR